MDKINNYARENYRVEQAPRSERIYDKIHREKLDREKKHRKKENDAYETATKHLVDVRA